MSDVGLVKFGFTVDTAQLTAADAALARMEKTAASLSAMLDKMGSSAASAFSKAKVPAGMMGGADAAGGSASSTAGWNTHAIGIGAVGAALDGYTAASTRATAATSATGGALRAGAEAHRAHGAAVGLNTSKMMELQHVARSLFDVVASGGSVFRGLEMEGGRLFQIFGPGTAKLKGAIEAFQAIPLAARLAGAGIAGGAAIAGAAVLSYEAAENRLANSLNGVGRRSGGTAGQFASVAETAGPLGRLSASESIDLAARYASTGLSPSITGGLLGVTRRYGEVTGLGTEKGGAQIADAMRDPIRGLAELDRSLGFVDDRLKMQVQDLERSGHLAQAQAVASEALRKALSETTVAATGFTKAMEGAGNFLSNAWHGLGHAVETTMGWNGDADKLAQARNTMANLQAADPVFNAPEIAQYRAEIARLEKVVGDQQAEAARKQRDAVAIGLSTKAGDAVRSILPDFVRANSARDTLEVLRQALDDPDIRRHMAPDDARLVGRAFGNAAVLGGMQSTGLHDRQDYDLRLASANAVLPFEKALVEARRAEIDILRQTGDVMRAAGAAQGVLNVAIAQRNRDAEEELRTARGQSSVIGLSGLQRRLEELRLQFEGPGGVFERDRVGSTRALDDPKIRGDFDMAAKWTDAARAGAASIEGAGSRLAAALDGVSARVAGGAASGGTGAAASPFGVLDRSAFAPGSGRTGQPMFAAMQSFIDRGYSPAAAAGFVAGLSMESSPSLDPTASNGSHLGVAQWDSARWGSLMTRLGPNAMSSQKGQLGGVFLELGTNEAGAGRMLAGANTVAGGIAASDAYERPGDVEAARRRGEAMSRGNALLAGYQGTPDRVALTVAPAAPVAPIASTTLDSDRQRLGVLQGNMIADTRETALNQANQALKAQNALLDVQASMFGKSDAATRGAIESQQLWNKLTADGLTPTEKLSDATGELADRVRLYGSDVERAAQRQTDEENRRKAAIAIADFGRSSISDVLTSGTTAAAHGGSFGDAAKGALSRIGDNLIGKGFSFLTDSFLGKAGTPFGGLLGGLFGAPEHHAMGGQAPGVPFIAGENGPELIDAPKGAQILTADQTGGLMASRGGGHTFNVGGPTIMIQGDVGEANRREIEAAVAAGQRQTIEHITRNLPTIQRDNGQFG